MTSHSTLSRAMTTILLSLGAAGSVVAAESVTAPADLPDKVTYSEDIAPILNDHCVRCHRPGDIAPMSLLSYEEVRPWAKSIRRVVVQRQMPPWHADRAQGVFKNDRSLDDNEIALIERWVKKGAKEGDPEALPTPPQFSNDWRLGTPDLILTFDEVALEGGGPDVFEDLTQKLDTDEDLWIRAVEVKPGNRRVVHHVILYATGDSGRPQSGWLGAWAAGMDPMQFPEGAAKQIPAGATLIADMHYHPDAEAATDQTQIGLYLYDGEPEKELINLWIQNANFRIPAGAPAHEVRASYEFLQDSIVYGLLPHMHYRGKDFTYTAHFPDGSSKILLRVNDYDFNWQTVYELAEPLLVPEGTRIDCLAHFDNSANNPDNPDPGRVVTFGNESYDEMMIGFVDYVVADGMRPVPLEEKLARLLDELAARHPGEVYSVRLKEADDDEWTDTVLHMPSSGDATWYIPMNGQLQKATLIGRVVTAGQMEAQVQSAFGTFPLTGTYQQGRIEGTITIPFAGDSLVYEGEVAASR